MEYDYFDFGTLDALTISLTFNFGCIVFFLLFSFLNNFKNTYEKSKSKDIEAKEIPRTVIRKKIVLMATTFRISHELLLLTTLTLACVCLIEVPVLNYPLFFPETYNIPSLLKVTFNINIGRYIFLFVGNIAMVKDSDFPAMLIHHFMTLCTYLSFSAYQQNAFLGICGIFMELSFTPVVISRILRDNNLHTRNMHRYYTFILIGCHMTFLFRAILPVACISYACYRQDVFSLRVVPMTFFFMCVIFYGIISIWLIGQAFITYKRTRKNKELLRFTMRALSMNSSLLSQTTLQTVNQIYSKYIPPLGGKTIKDFLESTQNDKKKIVFENNLLSNAAQLSQKTVNISNDAKRDTFETQQNVQSNDATQSSEQPCVHSL